MPRRAFSTTLDANTLKALKVLTVKQDRPLNKVLEEAAERYLADQAAADPDLQLFELDDETFLRVARAIMHLQDEPRLRGYHKVAARGTQLCI